MSSKINLLGYIIYYLTLGSILNYVISIITIFISTTATIITIKLIYYISHYKKYHHVESSPSHHDIVYVPHNTSYPAISYKSHIPVILNQYHLQKDVSHITTNNHNICINKIMLQNSLLQLSLPLPFKLATLSMFHKE